LTGGREIQTEEGRSIRMIREKELILKKSTLKNLVWNLKENIKRSLLVN